MSISCLYPVKIKVNGEDVTIPCGHCEACAYNKQSDWATRLEFEGKCYDRNAVLFVGLSYNDDHLPPSGSLHKRDLQLFMKRLRRFMFPRKCRFFAAGEYGETGYRPHYHVILFGVTHEDLKLFSGFYSHKLKGTVAFSKHWTDKQGNPKGRVTVQNICPFHYAYVAKYSTKKYHGGSAKDFEDYFGGIPEFVQMSRNPGIGRVTCERKIKKLRKDGAIWISPGKFKRLPRYFVDIVFPDKEDSEYKDWRDRRIFYALEQERKWNEKHKGLSREEARALKKQQILTQLESLKRKKGKFYVKSKGDIFNEAMEACKLESFNSFIERKRKETSD